MSTAFYEFLSKLSEQARITYVTMEASRGRKEKLVEDGSLITPTDAMILYYIIVDYRQLVTEDENRKALYETTIDRLDDILHNKQDDDERSQFSELVGLEEAILT